MECSIKIHSVFSTGRNEPHSPTHTNRNVELCQAGHPKSVLHLVYGYLDDGMHNHHLSGNWGVCRCSWPMQKKEEILQ